jgi:hypothetical protein
MKRGGFNMGEDKLRGTKFVELTREEAATIVSALEAHEAAYRRLGLNSKGYAYQCAQEIKALAERISEACVYPAMNHE